MILVVDNRDSFTFNLVQVLQELGAPVVVARSTELDPARARALHPAGLLVGPGPGGPRDAGASERLLVDLGGEIPTLGVCLGHQALASAFGGRVVRAAELVHGETRPVHHDGRGVFEGLSNPLELARYNSLAVEEASLPSELEVSARGPDGEIMGLRHRTRAIEGVQSHPESILCVDAGGRALLANFVAAVTRGA